jgi:hypothetical protein
MTAENSPAAITRNQRPLEIKSETGELKNEKINKTLNGYGQF